MKTQKHYNIITSCDDGLAPYVLVNLTAIALNLKDAHIDFYLLHSRVSEKNIELCNALCKEFENLTFHDILVADPQFYLELAKFGNGWVGEAYYSLCAHLLLPKDVSRVLYLDAGDTLVVGDIEPYYNCDFQEKSLVVTGARYKFSEGNLELFETEDLSAHLPEILRGIFNSGSYMMNLEQMRQDKRTLMDYQYLVNALKNIYGQENHEIYWGDQGLLSAAFVGNVRYYGFPEIRDVWYMPYNFCLWFYDQMNTPPSYCPAIVHFAGTKFKPWDGAYPIFLERFQTKERLQSLKELKIGQAEYFYLWHEYAMITDELLKKLGH